MNRRFALKALGIYAGLAATVRFAATNASAQAPGAQAVAPSGPFKLPPLPYAYDALEPYFDAETMRIHHDKHHAAYVNNLNAAVAGHPELASRSVDDLVANLNSLPSELQKAIRNQGGGHANHSFWWPTLSKSGGDAPKAELARDIDAQFGSLGNFQDELAKAATGVFGSGWTWLTLARNGKLQIETSANQDSPLTGGRTPVLGIDVWEHAYYLKYQNRRPDFVAAFSHVVNWEYVSGQYASAKAAQRGA